MKIEFTIEGQCWSMKNARKPITIRSRHTGKPRTIFVLNEKAKAFEREFAAQLPESARQHLTSEVGVAVTIYYPSNQQDLDEALVLDLMQKYGVIKNDRQVVTKNVKKLIDPDRPRVVVKVLPVQWDKTGLQPTLYADTDPDVVHEMGVA